MLTPQYDFLVVGAGLFGATFAHLMTQRGQRCLVVDRRPHAGGNIYCQDHDGIAVHAYGAHIFHTSDAEVWRLATGLVPFNRYTNSPVAIWQDRMYNLPFNMNTFAQMWGVRTPAEARAVIDSQRAEARRHLAEAGAEAPRNLEEQALLLVGRDIYERLIKGYTEKQWGRPCTELPAFIIKRLPVRFVYDNNYFNDRWQGIPCGGYNGLTAALLAGSDVRLNTDYLADRAALDAMARHTVFTGQIDEFYNYCYGALAYRTVRFEHERLEESNAQGCAVVNYTERHIPYTRIIEHKHFDAFGDDVERLPFTILSREYPGEWQPGTEPYYPVNDDANSALYARYRALADAEERTSFGGRLAEYRYYDMAPVMRRAIDLANALSAR